MSFIKIYEVLWYEFNVTLVSLERSAYLLTMGFIIEAVANVLMKYNDNVHLYSLSTKDYLYSSDSLQNRHYISSNNRLNYYIQYSIHGSMSWFSVVCFLQ